MNLYKVRNSSNSDIQICGKRRDVPQDNIEAFLVDLQKPKDEYRDENILNANETALFYRLLPERTIERNHAAAVGKKFLKHRITLLLCCSVTAEQLPPLVIGKYENPRCLRGINHKKLPCSYKSLLNAWMTTSLWSSWLSEFNSRMVLQKRHVLLFADNAKLGGHLIGLMLNFQTPKFCLFLSQIVLPFCSHFAESHLSLQSFRVQVFSHAIHQSPVWDCLSMTTFVAGLHAIKCAN